MNRLGARAMQITPAPGFRDAFSDRGYGRLWYIGHDGFSWSSAIPAGSGDAHYLLFYYGGIGPQNYNYRAYGFQLRCLQE